MADLTDKQASLVTRIAGDDEVYCADVEYNEGKKCLRVLGEFEAEVSIEEILGFDDYADCWFTVDVAGGIGDTITVYIRQISGSGYDSVVITLTSNEAGDREELTKLIVNVLNADSTFKASWKAARVKDNYIVHISSLFLGEYGERPNAVDFYTTETGTTDVTAIQDRILRKGKTVSLTRDARDKRYGMLGISGEVQVTPGLISETFDINALNGSSGDLTVDGSSTPVDFYINADVDADLYVCEIKIYGADNGIKFGQFLAYNLPLTNGIEITIRSDDKVRVLPLIKTTEDFKDKFACPVTNFRLDIQAGQDGVIGSRQFANPFPIRKQGTYDTDDYIRIRIQDNLLARLYLEFVAMGFKENL